MQRYSVRKFKPDKIDRSILLSCLEAARLAPSACNIQPWKFIVVDDEEIKTRIVDETLSSVHSFNQFVSTAPCIVVAIADPDFVTNKLAATLQGTKYYLFDIGIACQDLVLKAWELDVGSCYIGWFNEKKLKRILDIPKMKKVVMMIALGHFDKEDRSKVRKSMEEICFFNSWKN